jgi:hypothetical protein
MSALKPMFPVGLFSLEEAGGFAWAATRAEVTHRHRRDLQKDMVPRIKQECSSNNERQGE